MKSSTRVTHYLEGFAQQNSSKLENLFSFADKRGRCGFEKWLQFELMLFFRAQGIEVSLEEKVRSDKRKSVKSHFRTDIVVHMKSGDTIGLELKVRRLAAGAVRGLLSDIKKHGRTRENDKATANFAVVLCGEDIGETRRKELSNDLPEFHIIKAGKTGCFLMAGE